MFEIFRKPSSAIESLQDVRRGGLYVVTLQEPKAFGADFLAEHLGRNKCNLLPENTVYVGKGDNLRKRLCQEFWQTNRATFFRSVGALLDMEPYINQKSPTNYMFDGLSKSTIINFIENNMMVSYMPLSAFDSAQTERDTGFRAETSFSDGCKRTYDWWKKILGETQQ